LGQLFASPPRCRRSTTAYFATALYLGTARPTAATLLNALDPWRQPRISLLAGITLKVADGGKLAPRSSSSFKTRRFYSIISAGFQASHLLRVSCNSHWVSTPNILTHETGSITKVPRSPGSDAPAFTVEAQSGDKCRLHSWVVARHQVSTCYRMLLAYQPDPSKGCSCLGADIRYHTE
jgi:hypothetical protein